MLRKLYYLVVIFLAIFVPLAALAEGSKDLTANGLGFRPFLEDSSDESNGIFRTNVIQVYAEVGEVIELGSSAMRMDGNGDMLATIVATSPTGERFDCVTLGGDGLIANRTEEVNGTFTPCEITVGTTVGTTGGTGETGIWEIQFVAPASYDPTTGDIRRRQVNNPTPIPVTADFPAAGAADTFIAAWDVTVRKDNADQLGRVFANYLALNTGFVNEPVVNSVAFVQTEDGYLYEVDLNGMYAAGFIFFANEDGFTDNLGKSRYQSVDAPRDNSITDTSSDPITADPTDAQNDDVTHKIFFNDPNSSGDLPLSSSSFSRGNTWLLNSPEIPSSPTNLRFIGKEGSVNQAGTNPLEGSFFFDSVDAGITYSLAIDIDDNGSYTDDIDRVIFGTSSSGENEVVWDGTDGQGNDVPPNDTGYTAVAKFFTGEVHFPFIDVERNVNGLEIIRQTALPFMPPAGDSTYESDWVYYDDSGVTSTTGNNGQPDPLTVLNGVNSTGGAHAFGGSGVDWGNQLGIDTWVLVPSVPAELSGRILVLEADLDISKELTTTTLVSGGEISYTITVTNNGPSNLTGDRKAGVTDSFPDQIVNGTWTCAITTGTGACTAESGSGDIDTTVELESGAVATFTVTGGLASDPTSQITITNSATVTRPDDVTDPNDQDDSGGDNTTETVSTTFNGTIEPSNPVLGIAKEAGTVTNNNDGTYTIPYTLVVSNTGNVSFNNVQVTEDLATTFGDSTFTIEELSSSDLTVNDSFDGRSDTNLLAGTDSLDVSTSGSIVLTVRVTPGSDLPAYTNTVQVSGTTPGGEPFTDDSTDGSDPDPDGDGDPTNNEEPTVDSFEVPRLGVAKAAGTPVDNNDGTYTIPYTVVVSNSGNVDIENLQVSDDLSTTFSGVIFSVQPISSSDLAVNNNFNGESDTNLLAGTDTLAVDSTAEISFDVLITPGSNEGPFENTATADGTSPGGTSVSDDSTDGSDPDPDGDYNPKNNDDPTTVSISTTNTGTPSLRLVKRVTRVNDTILNSEIDDPSDANDDSSLSWPSGYLLGEVDVPDILPGDEVEYTIYFLSDGAGPAINVRICDRIPENQTFLEDAFNGLTQATGEFVGADRGIAIGFGPANPQSYTNANGDDEASFFSAGNQINSPPCSTANNSNGAIIWDLGNVTNFSDDVNNSYGFVRFRVRVD